MEMLDWACLLYINPPDLMSVGQSCAFVSFFSLA